MIKAVLFDLDGTLLDTAQDFTAILNDLAQQHQRPALSLQSVAAIVSQGTHAMLQHALGISSTDPNFAAIKKTFLDLYLENMHRYTKPFQGIEELLAQLQTWTLPWGVVTNKYKALTEPLLTHFPFSYPPQCIVSGDTLAYHKPDPRPLLHAAQLLKIPAQHCLYVGDAETDIIAGKRAGMRTVVAQYGYIAPQEDPHLWQADGYIQKPLELLAYITNID